MFAVWVVCAFQMTLAMGFLAPFSGFSFFTDRDRKALRYNELFSTQDGKWSKRIRNTGTQSIARSTPHQISRTKPVCSLQSDEDLFVDLFLNNKKRNSAGNSGDKSKIRELGIDGSIDRNRVPSSFNIDEGAGSPRPTLKPDEIVPLLMMALENVNVPVSDAGLIAMWDFASDTTKFVFKNNRTEFIESCHETAAEFPTSFYGAAMNGKSWTIETDLNRVGGEDGWIATQVTATISSDGRLRRWQWELRKNRRPPCLGCWKVENIASSDRKGNFEPD